MLWAGFRLTSLIKLGRGGSTMSDITPILERIRAGDREATQEILPRIYDELRRIAAAKMKNENADHTLQATALVHEAWLRLMPTLREAAWDSRRVSRGGGGGDATDSC